MKSIVLAILLSAVACPGWPAEQTVTLKQGESTSTVGGESRVGFERVIGDSRCPKGVQCVWAGDAIVRIWIQHGAGMRESIELHTHQGKSGATRNARIVRLDPYPTTNSAIDEKEYVLTLTFDSAASTDPDR